MSYLSVVPGQPHHTGRTASSEVRTAHPRQLYTLHLPRDSNPPTLPTKKREGVGLGCSSCHRATDAEAMNKQDAPFLDLSERSSKFGFSASGVGGLLASLGLCTLGGSSVRVDREVLTLAPWCSRASAKALPMPCAAPVTRATLPFTCMVGHGSASGGRALRLCSATAFMVPSARLCSGPGS